MVVVAGPRIDPASLPEADGLEVRAYVHNLYRHLAACDLAVVQGGLTTVMELTAAGGRSSTSRCATTSSRTSTWPTACERYGAGRRMDFADRDPGGDRRRRSPTRSAARSTTARWRPTAPPGRPALIAELLAVVDQTVQPARASLWLRAPARSGQEPLGA